MSLAAATRDAVRARPFLADALRAGVLNYAAAARLLREEVDALADADEDTVTAALRRFGDDLAPYEPATGDARVSMRSGVGPVENAADEVDEPLLRVGGTALAAGGTGTAIVVEGTVDAGVLAGILDRLRTAAVAVEAAGVAGDALVVVVPRRSGPDALRIVEDCV
ncbi:DUF7523 family protein [Halomarina oriensis]|uniref:Uncharacterized protein n=1 Tax=Halomarina oriensis TaxID=671145 RepID=A0A6B0GXJ2_9EURY|nr:hypothetical protein [Halomarina oriensis]MWG36855.1 hypothetical protein [Halomarina oriensis]